MTGSRKRGHFPQEFKIELLVLKGRVALTKAIICGIFVVVRNFSR